MEFLTNLLLNLEHVVFFFRVFVFWDTKTKNMAGFISDLAALALASGALGNKQVGVVEPFKSAGRCTRAMKKGAPGLGQNTFKLVFFL